MLVMETVDQGRIFNLSVAIMDKVLLLFAPARNVKKEEAREM
jgi:hypothetical protein